MNHHQRQIYCVGDWAQPTLGSRPYVAIVHLYTHTHTHTPSKTFDLFSPPDLPDCLSAILSLSLSFSLSLFLSLALFLSLLISVLWNYQGFSPRRCQQRSAPSCGCCHTFPACHECTMVIRCCLSLSTSITTILCRLALTHGCRCADHLLGREAHPVHECQR